MNKNAHKLYEYITNVINLKKKLDQNFMHNACVFV